ncbi:cyclic lactone autoinducer peptide [Coprobacillus sp. AF15-30]|nr:cyclic lactone autoinducer peptide [Coprobacillus sp. AF15-30]
MIFIYVICFLTKYIFCYILEKEVKKMKKILYLISIFVFSVAKFSANTPSQIVHFQPNAPSRLKK